MGESLDNNADLITGERQQGAAALTTLRSKEGLAGC